MENFLVTIITLILLYELQLAFLILLVNYFLNDSCISVEKFLIKKKKKLINIQDLISQIILLEIA